MLVAWFVGLLEVSLVLDVSDLRQRAFQKSKLSERCAPGNEHVDPPHDGCRDSFLIPSHFIGGYGFVPSMNSIGGGSGLFVAGYQVYNYRAAAHFPCALKSGPFIRGTCWTLGS